MIDIKLIEKCEQKLQNQFKYLDEVSLYNQEKVLNAFKKNKIALRHFNGSTGYGYGDEGRDTLNSLVADIFCAESAICSPSFVSGTHTLSACLFALLRPGDTFISISGTPYDTLIDVINGDNIGSLKDYGVKFDSISLKDGKFDYEKIDEFLSKNKVKMVYIQRSRGYEWRDALTIDDLSAAVKHLRNSGFNGIIMLDNCYGEFVEKREALEVGVNIVAGSMIKNLGGGIVPTGGYVAGDKRLIELVQNRLTAPSIGGEVGSYAFGYQYFYEGLFLAPHVVKEALKGSLLFGAVLDELHIETSPSAGKAPADIIRAIKFNDKNLMIDFINVIQQNSPIDSFVRVEPWDMPGYSDQVIMAAGCFVQGASIELSADGPVKPPYIAYMQGGLTYEHLKIALKNLKI